MVGRYRGRLKIIYLFIAQITAKFYTTVWLCLSKPPATQKLGILAGKTEQRSMIAFCDAQEIGCAKWKEIFFKFFLVYACLFIKKGFGCSPNFFFSLTIHPD